MKTNVTIKHLLLAFTIVLSMAACKKDKKDPEPTLPPEVKSMTFTELKALSTGASVKVPDAKKIKGIVISDVSSKNIDSKTVILQESADKQGIIITFDAAQTFALNDEVEVNISNQTLAQVDGEIILQNVPAANAKKTGTGTIAAKATTIADLKTNKAALNGTLVTIAATELTGTTGKYAGNLTITDVSGTITSTVLTSAFTDTDLPPSVSAITGIVRISGTDARVDLRKTSDVVTGAITRILVENFDNITEGESKIEQQHFGDLSSEFTTAVGHYWAAGSYVYKYLGSLYDGSFTTPDRNYPYVAFAGASGTVPYNNAFIMTDFSNLQGVKTVKITFAGSTTTKIKRYESGGNETPIDAFNPAVDNIQIGVYLKSTDQGAYLVEGDDALSLLKVSPQYKETGKFYSFTYTMPTKAELLAAGVSEQNADTFLANPNIAIYNYSTHTGTVSFPNRAPILFDKIEFGF